MISFDFSSPIIADVDIYAGWIMESQEKCTVAFDTDGGTYVPFQTIAAGEKISIPETPSKNGFIFAGWYLDKYFSQAFDFSTPIYSDLILYAKWEVPAPTKFTVSFNANKPAGAVSTVQNLPNPIVVISGGMVGTIEAPSLEGYIFEGWYTEDGKLFIPEEEIITKDIMLYAAWTQEPSPNRYSVTFRYGEAVLYTDEVEEGLSVSIPSGKTGTAELTERGDSFSYIVTENTSWTDAEGNPFDFSAVINSDIELFADSVDIESFTVSSEEGLFAWADAVNLQNDIDCTLLNDIELTKAWIPVTPYPGYSGRFDGQGYKIASLVVNDFAQYETAKGWSHCYYVAGFFGQIAAGGEVVNLNLDIRIEGAVSSKADIFYAGGIAGVVSEKADISGCSVDFGLKCDTSVLNSGYAGGIVGFNEGTIHNSYSIIQDIYVATDGLYFGAGGIAGYNSSEGSIIACSSVSTRIFIRMMGNDYNFSSQDSYFSYIGGIVGNNYGSLMACYSYSTNLRAYTYGNYSYVGGIVGRDVSETVITACYSVSDSISAYTFGPASASISRVGGFSGCISSAAACFWKSAEAEKGSGYGNSDGIIEIVDDDWSVALQEMNNALPVDFEWEYVNSNGELPLILERR